MSSNQRFGLFSLFAAAAISVGVQPSLAASCEPGASIADQKLSGEVREKYEWALALDNARRVNGNWSVDCTTDAVTAMRKCFAAAFGCSMNARGDGYGVAQIPFQIQFIDEAGPFIVFPLHNYSGRKPIVRFDDQSEFQVVEDDGGVTEVRAQPDLVDRLKAAALVRARYAEWPDGFKDIIIDVVGFDDAWARLVELKAGAPAPSELAGR